MVRESLYVLFLMSEFSGISSRLILDFPVTSKSQKVPYMESLCYPPKNPLRKTFFPSHDLWAIIFAVVIFILTDGLGNGIVLKIDEEYTGKEEVIREILEKLLKRKFPLSGATSKK